MLLSRHNLLKKLRNWSETRGISEKFYLVGGSVRDLLLGNFPSDIDVAVESDSMRLARTFAAEAGARLVVLSKEFQSVRVVQNGEHLDFSDLRAESLENDLKARDFTIDAIALPIRAVNLNKQIIDPCNGLADLNSGIIRMIAEKNICEDPLRLLRAFRIEAVLGFSVEEKTAQAIKRHAHLITGIAGERIFTELKAILACSNSSQTVEAMAETGLLPWIFSKSGTTCKHVPNVLPRESRQAAYREVEGILSNLNEHFEDSLPIETYFRDPKHRLLLKLAVLLYDVERPKSLSEADSLVRRVAARLKISRIEISYLEQIIPRQSQVQQLLESQDHQRKTLLVRLIRQLGNDIYALVVFNLAITKYTTKTQKALFAAVQHLMQIYHQEVLPRLNNPRLITGDDIIMEFAIDPSPVIGEILDNVDQAYLKGSINSRQEAVELARKILSDKKLGYNQKNT